uniref:NADPH-dependent FMN reductase-like domain-containing protein n=1 Tax=Strigamia maritima TaxID=126957 RepID=T1IMV9_STRMM
MALKVTVFFGSVREGRWGFRAAKYIAQQLRKKDYEVFLYDPEAIPIPLLRKPFHHYQNPDDAPQYLQDVRKEIISSDAFIVVAAEYNHSMPPALVNAMDHFHPDDYRHKPCGICTYSYGSFGGVRAGVQLRSFLGELGMITPSYMFPIPTILESFTEDGVPQNEHMIKNTEKLIDEVGWYAQALKNHRESIPPPV